MFKKQINANNISQIWFQMVGDEDSIIIQGGPDDLGLYMSQ